MGAAHFLFGRSSCRLPPRSHDCHTMLHRVARAGLGEVRRTAVQKQPLLLSQRHFNTGLGGIGKEWSADAGNSKVEGKEEGADKEGAGLANESKSLDIPGSFANPKMKQDEATRAHNNSWTSVIQTLTSSLPSSSRFPDFSYNNNDVPQVHTSDVRVDPMEEFEAVWTRRALLGADKPAKPMAGRSCDVDGVQIDAARGYGILNSILGRNNVRYELRLKERYEKPNQEKRRLRSQRHRRRFADAVRQKVQLVSSAVGWCRPDDQRLTSLRRSWTSRHEATEDVVRSHLTRRQRTAMSM